MTRLPGFLEKLLSQAALKKALDLIMSQPAAATPQEGKANHAAVVEGVYLFVEQLDDKVSLIPYAGPILAALVDSPAVDAQERKWTEFLVELAYQSLKLGGETEPAAVTDPVTVKPGPEPGTPTTPADFGPSMATNPPGSTK